ncbi:hypothetical protein SCLCIDRAFT_28101 [Scleroderma citrinum Foug A]|uniref:Uncharacterized protein n=1 Tax=Scleroderma citrinum Foug A TaxID=1036808 RepID=A0A0C3A195_9AGAM|nr:hypothetical protein SCLCIDRAFT_28101 [Scleroderma citrinum Foug A]
MEIKNFFLPGNNKEWARSQLLRLRQGPHQRINDFLAQFQALKLKTHKRFATSVPSPISVSPNKYASLVVENVDTQCTMDSADMSASFVSFTSATVPSMGVPRSGSAPDVKRGVLNSHVLINGQKFPSLASSDSESLADDLEVGFPVELRRTVTMEHEVQIPV